VDANVGERYVAALGAADVAALERLRHPEYVVRWPQSGELVRGRARIGALERADPGGPPRFAAVRRILGQDDLWTIEAVALHPDGSRWWWVSILEVHDDLVTAEAAYVCEPLAAPAWRAGDVQPIDGEAPPSPLPPAAEPSTRTINHLASVYRTAIQTRDGAALGTVRGPAWTCDWPQSAERIPDHAADVAIHSAYPGYPHETFTRVQAVPEAWAVSPLFTPVRIHGAGPLVVLEGANDYPRDGRWFVAGLLEVGDDRVRRETMYFGRPVDPPAWRAQLVERFDPLVAR